MGKRALRLILTAVAIAVGLTGVTLLWLGRNPAPPVSGVAIASAQPPVLLAIVPTRWITADSQSMGYGMAYYREATGYISTTVAAGAITYTWQSSPDNAVWFDYGTVAQAASGRATTTLANFGPYVRVAWDAGPSASVTATVWLSLKE